MLQPLVENAIEHGTADREGVSRVEIRGRRQGDTLLLEVENLWSQGAGDRGSVERAGTGLQNTHARLEHLYPGRFSMHHGPIAGGRFVTTIRIPARAQNGARAELD